MNARLHGEAPMPGSGSDGEPQVDANDFIASLLNQLSGVNYQLAVAGAEIERLRRENARLQQERADLATKTTDE